MNLKMWEDKAGSPSRIYTLGRGIRARRVDLTLTEDKRGVEVSLSNYKLQPEFVCKVLVFENDAKARNFYLNPDMGVLAEIVKPFPPEEPDWMKRNRENLY